MKGKWEKRWHPLRGEWIVYASHRNQRPWQGAYDAVKENYGPDYDPKCYLCPTNGRVSGKTNPDYQDVFVFENDHPVVGMDSPDVEQIEGLYQKSSAKGKAFVICYHPKHNISLSEAELSTVYSVMKAWRQLTLDLKSDPIIQSILIFENKGEIVGVSNPHPHCQCYATDFILPDTQRELLTTEQYFSEKGENLMGAIIKQEQKDGNRIIAENEFAIAFLPFFARFAYEVYVVPKKHHQDLSTLSDEECEGLAKCYQEVIRKYDMNYSIRFPYVMNCMQAPVDGKDYPYYSLRFQFLPPLRQPNLKKYLAGPELGAGAYMADTMPEEKAAELRAQNLENYKPLI